MPTFFKKEFQFKFKSAILPDCRILTEPLDYRYFVSCTFLTVKWTVTLQTVKINNAEIAGEKKCLQNALVAVASQ